MCHGSSQSLEEGWLAECGTRSGEVRIVQISSRGVSNCLSAEGGKPHSQVLSMVAE
jgi:hypothetical protein